MGEQPGTLDVAALTDIGLKRKRNEDTCDFRIPEPNTPQHAHGALFVVADGMGGMSGGDVASRTAVRTLLDAYYAAPFSPGTDPERVLKTALNAANEAVRARAREANLLRIGSTAAGVLLLPDGEAVIFNVGDARVYRIRQNMLEQLSHDQSVLQHQLDAGVISEEEARQARNVNVTAFIGQERPLEAVYRRARVQTGDVFLLCSDGLWDLVKPHEMLRIVEQYSAEVATRRLVELARKRGAPDNVTVIVVRIGTTVRRALWRGWQGVAALVVLALIAVGVWLAFLRGDEDGGEPHDDQGAARPTLEAPTGTPQDSARTPDASPTGGAAVTILSSDTPTVTPSPRASVTATPSPTGTQAVTQAVLQQPRDTASATHTRTHTPTASRTPTATLTVAHTPQPPTATRTPLPSPTASPTGTASPTRTPTPRPPTVTVDPAVISPTPSLSPTPTPTLTAGQRALFFAADGGVTLDGRATLYVFEADDAPPRAIALSAGTGVRLLGDAERAHPDAAGRVLREVEVLSGLHLRGRGWIDVGALEAAAPLQAYVVARDRGANLRRGDSTGYAIVSSLAPGQIARITGTSARLNGWYAVERLDGVRGWVAADVVDVYGATAGLPLITAPPLPEATPIASQAPTAQD